MSMDINVIVNEEGNIKVGDFVELRALLVHEGGKMIARMYQKELGIDIFYEDDEYSKLMDGMYEFAGEEEDGVKFGWFKEGREIRSKSYWKNGKLRQFRDLSIGVNIEVDEKGFLRKLKESRFSEEWNDGYENKLVRNMSVAKANEKGDRGVTVSYGEDGMVCRKASWVEFGWGEFDFDGCLFYFEKGELRGVSEWKETGGKSSWGAEEWEAKKLEDAIRESL